MDKRSMMQAPVISVICPVYNGERFLAETLDSVLRQDIENFELLIVDDGSTDSTDQIIRRYVAQYPGRIFNFAHVGNANRGVCASRNLGISKARGQFIAFIDADDLWRPEKLREQMTLLETMQDVDLVAGTANYWKSWRGEPDLLVKSGQVQNRPIRPPEATLNIYPIGRGTAPGISDLLIRADLVRAIGGFEERFVGDVMLLEDQAFLSKIYLEGTVYFTERVWFDYRLHDSSAMHQARSKGLRDQSKKFYFAWFEEYLRGKQSPHAPRIRIAVLLARIRDHPSLLARGVRRAKRVLRRTLRR